MKRIGIFFAEGYEEIEALTVVDMCRRAGITIDMISVTEEKEVIGAHNISVKMELSISEVNWTGYDAIVLPGGWPGTPNLETCEVLMKQVKKYFEEGKLVAAICAAPSILGHLGILHGKKACCFPGFEQELAGAEVMYDTYVEDGNIITSRGMGCAIDFSVAIINKLLDSNIGDELSQKIIYKSEN